MMVGGRHRMLIASWRTIPSSLCVGLSLIPMHRRSCACPITYATRSSLQRDHLQDEFLMGIGVDFRQDWLWEDSVRAFDAWNTFIQRRRARLAPKRPLADILIGSFASRYDGLLTRNPDDFRSAFPDLQLRVPSPQDEGTD